MKPKANHIVGVAVALFTLAASQLQAQVLNVVTISGTALVQSPSSQTGFIVTTPAGAKFSLTTKSLLIAMAVYEKLAGHYFGPVPFPAGSKLVAAQFYAGLPRFEVLDKTNHLLVDVSDILVGGPSNFFDSTVASGKFNSVTLLAAPTQSFNELYTLSFNDTAVVGSSNVKFNLIGVMTHSRTDGRVSASTGIYTESQTNKMSAAGDGKSSNVPLTITGSVSFSGKAPFVF
jgi:hypothetical protein